MNSGEEVKGVTKVAILAGFVGTNFRGSEFNPNERTVEGELRAALRTIGAASWGKKLKRKYQWGRTGRTDSGVHATRYVVSVLLRETSSVEGVDNDLKEKSVGYRCHKLVENLNEILPQDLVVWEAVIVPVSFDARRSCSVREYKYHLPLTQLVDNEKLSLSCNEVTAAVSRFEKACEQYLGLNSYHNFTKVGKINSLKHYLNENAAELPFSIRKPRRRHQDEKNSGSFNVVQCNENEKEWSILAKQSTSTKSGLEEWPRRILREIKSSVYNTQVSVDYGEDITNSWVSIVLKGNKFSYNQIRHMIGAAVMVARNKLTVAALKACLTVRCATRLPLAPAIGLVLSSSSYAFTDEQFCVAMDREQLILMNQGFHNVQVLPKLAESDHQAYQQSALDCSKSEGFVKTIILSESGKTAIEEFDVKVEELVRRLWNSHEGRGVAEWEWHTERFSPETSVLSTLTNYLQEECSIPPLTGKHETSRMLYIQRLVSTNEVEFDFMGKLWPVGFVPQMLSRFKLIPGRGCRLLQLGLVEAILHKEIAPSSDTETLLAYIQKKTVQGVCKAGMQSKLSFIKEIE